MIQEFVKELINELKKIPTEYRHEEYNSAIWDVIKFTKGFAEKYSDAVAVPITPEMKADLLDCIKETKVPGGGKDCNKCSLNKTNYHGKAFCEVEQIKEKILQGAEAVTPDTEEKFRRLAEYEALGVTAKQIREMDRLYAEKCKEVAELEKRLQKLKGDMK